ncbi:MAG: GGDEF domain-containing protein [Gemmatimonadaceae bacterium]|nr:GGDEF domain-containing protein [Gemmatimonadaceae bacterium]
MAQSPAVYFAPDAAPLPELARDWFDARGLTPVLCRTLDELMAMALRGRPLVVIFDARTQAAASCAACVRLKNDSYTGVVPAGMFVSPGEAALAQGFAAGADEVLAPNTPDAEVAIRLDVMLRRADRDVHVHPSTRLPGAPEIEAAIGIRLAAGELFAACYADLDHFKEYNDRYSYFEGDRVIRILAKILHDVVRGLSPEGGFVGHIGGDDFIFLVPMLQAPEICQEIVSIFDLLVPYQYSEQDRQAGYYFGKDRRGQLHRVPLMTVSIGVVTNERRTFSHPAQVSELATEMKSYAKTLNGSVYVVDRRNDPILGSPVGVSER